MTSQLTKTEAETLAVMLDSASRKMSKVQTRDGYVWEWPYEATRDMFRCFYDITFGLGVYI